MDLTKHKMELFSYIHASDQSISITIFFNFYQGVQNQLEKQGMELYKQEIKLFLLFPDIRSFTILIFLKES